jgi:spore coat polysaccharide biosynthesis protein SpsF
VTRTVAIIQARTGSTRLPGKVLLDLAGEPVLARVVERTRRAVTLGAVVVATTSLPEDDAIEALARDRGWPVTRGHPTDLLDRYCRAAREQRAEVVARITSDCPLVDPALIDETVEAFRAGKADYASNTLEPRTYPRGLDVEVVAIAALERAWREDDNHAWREHATPYIYRHPELFRLFRVAGTEDQSAHRWTVDTPQDLELVRRIYTAIGRDDFGWREALAMVLANPAWTSLNREVQQESVQP